MLAFLNSKMFNLILTFYDLTVEKKYKNGEN